MLRQPHGPQRAGVGAAGVGLRRAPDHAGRHAGDFRRALGRVGLDRGADFLKVVGALGEECPVLKTLGEDVLQHRRVERDIGARLHLEVDVGAAGEFGAAGVGDDERRPARVRPLDGGAEHRVRLGGVRAGDENDVARGLDLAHRPRGG